MITAEHIHRAAARMDTQRLLGEAWVRWQLCPRRNVRERAALRRQFNLFARQALRTYR